MCKCICSQIAQQYTRLDPDAEIIHVILNNPVHSLRGKNDPSVHRNTTAYKPGSRSSHSDRNFSVVADLHDLRDFFCCFCKANCLWQVSAVNRHFVMRIIRFDSAARKETLFSNDRLQRVSNIRCQTVIFCHKTLLFVLLS